MGTICNLSLTLRMSFKRHLLFVLFWRNHVTVSGVLPLLSNLTCSLTSGWSRIKAFPQCGRKVHRVVTGGEAGDGQRRVTGLLPVRHRRNNMSNRKHRDNQEICARKVRELAQSGVNKHCFECNQPGVTYTDITVGSFVCTSCSGMLWVRTCFNKPPYSNVASVWRPRPEIAPLRQIYFF